MNQEWDCIRPAREKSGQRSSDQAFLPRRTRRGTPGRNNKKNQLASHRDPVLRGVAFCKGPGIRLSGRRGTATVGPTEGPEDQGTGREGWGRRRDPLDSCRGGNGGGNGGGAAENPNCPHRPHE